MWRTSLLPLPETWYDGPAAPAAVFPAEFRYIPAAEDNWKVFDFTATLVPAVSAAAVAVSTGVPLMEMVALLSSSIFEGAPD
jgi:hypothetical protein